MFSLRAKFVSLKRRLRSEPAFQPRDIVLVYEDKTANMHYSDTPWLARLAAQQGECWHAAVYAPPDAPPCYRLNPRKAAIIKNHDDPVFLGDKDRLKLWRAR